MFAKSKRFQDGPKEYIPGPGEYNVETDELGKHKRYGFLNQTNRFSTEVADPPLDFFPAGEYSTPSLSSETRLSLSTSSNKTEDAKIRRQITDMTSQFEKYRHTMQKEVEALQLKNRKLESSLQTALSDKTNTQSILLTKDQELAEARSKNKSLEKSVSRLEKNLDKSPKVIQLQKQVDQLQKELNAVKAETERVHADAEQQRTRSAETLQEKEHTIAQLQERVSDQAETLHTMETRLEQAEARLTSAQEQHTRTMESLQAQLQTVTRTLDETQENLVNQELKYATLIQEMEKLRKDMDAVSIEKTRLEAEMHDQKAQHQQELESCHALQAGLEEGMQQLQNKLSERDEALSLAEARHQDDQRLLAETQATVAEQEQHLAQKTVVVQQLQIQFQTYRQHNNQVTQALRERVKAIVSYRDNELGRVMHELREAKKFINAQAQNVDGLKSELHWMSKWNRNLHTLLRDVQHDTDQYIATLWIEKSSRAGGLINDSGFFATSSPVKSIPERVH